MIDVVHHPHAGLDVLARVKGALADARRYAPLTRAARVETSTPWVMGDACLRRGLRAKAARGVERLDEDRHERSTRELPMRQRLRLIRASRQRTLPTVHGHAALPSATRGYQSDSSSKRPTSSILSTPRATGPPSCRSPRRLWLDERSLHIRKKKRPPRGSAPTCSPRHPVRGEATPPASKTPASKDPLGVDHME